MGLVVCENKTVTGMNRSFMGRNDRSALNHWLTDSGWSEEELDRARKEMIIKDLRARRLKNGVLVVDDTISHKTGKRMEGVNIHYDHSEGRCVLGHQLVTSDLVIGSLSLPLDFELYSRDEGQPDFKTKQELFRILVRRAANEGFHSHALSGTSGTSTGGTWNAWRRWVGTGLQPANLIGLYSCLEAGPIGWVKAGLATVGSRCRYAAMEVLKSFIELVMELARKVRTPDEILRLTLLDLKGLKTYTRWR